MENGVDRPVVLAVDGNSLVHRSFHASAASAATSADGRPCWAVRGLVTQLVAAVERVRPAAVVIGFDDPSHSHRRERWPAYKAHRGEKLDTLVEQLERAVEVMRALGVAVVVPPGLEADDVLAGTARHAREHGADTVVVTSDRDAFALIDDRTTVLRIINGGVEASPLMTADRLVTLLGVRPEQYRDFAALRGDPSDNLPGVRGIGPRHAARLLAEFGTAAAAFADPAAVRERLGAGVAAKLAAEGAHAAWQLNCQVMAFHADLEIELDLAGGAGVLPFAADAVGEVFDELGLPWSRAKGLRVLAGIEPDPAAVPVVAGSPWSASGGDSRWTSPGRTWRGSDRPPRKVLAASGARAARRPAVEQLSLFD